MKARTTLVLDDRLMRQLKVAAARERQTLSGLVEALLRRGLEAARARPRRLPPLPAFHAGRELVDVADRNALYAAMERDG